jgi:hypothetical protein
VAESVVTLRVETRNAVSSLNKASAATNKLSLASKGATQSLAQTSTAAQALGTALRNSVAPILAVGTAFGIVNNSIGTFLARERDISILRQGLANLGAGSVELDNLQKVADKFGKTTLFNQEDFTRGFNLLTSFRNIGVDAYERVAQSAADIAQVNQVDVSTSFMQLAKALQDPERNLSNLNRSGIAFTKQQQKVIKELMKTNKIAEAHAMILDIVDESYNKLAQAAAVGFAGSVDTLGEEFRDFAETIGEALVPVLDPAAKGLTAILGFLNSAGGQATAIIGGLTLGVKGLAFVLPLLQTNFLKVKVAAQIFSGQLVTTKATLAATSVGFRSAAAASTAFKIALAKTGIGLAVLALGAFVTKLIEAIDAQKEFNKLLDEGSSLAIQKAIDDTKKEIEKLEDQIKSVEESMGFFYNEDNILTDQLKKAQDELAKLEARLPITQGVELFREFEKAKKELQEQNDELKDIEAKLKIGTEEGKKQFDLEKRTNELVEKYGKELAQQILDQEKENRKLEDSIKLLKEKDEAAQKLKDRFMEIGQSVEDGIVSNLADAVEGTKTLAEAAISVLNDLKRKLIEVAIQQAVSGIGGKVGTFLSSVFKREKGGPVSAGGTYLVGEKGPEILKMGSRSGNIIPNNQIGGGSNYIVNVSVDAKGTSVAGNNQDANLLGQAIATAVQSQLIKEKRAGGLLSR